MDGTSTKDRTGNGNGGGAIAPTLTVELHHDLGEIEAAPWDGLLARSSEPTVFLRHAYLQALHTTGCAAPPTGWQPLVLLARRDGALAGACLVYLKSHSYGEYVFDWAWANAYERAGHRYYPKLLGAVPFTPVPGTRLLTDDPEVRQVLLQALRQLTLQEKFSSAHLLFLSRADRDAAEADGWMLRTTVQFHWENRQAEAATLPLKDDTANAIRELARPYGDFADFLSSLTRDKRKKIQQERRYVREAGVTFQALRGTEITDADWDHFHRCYERTYRAHASTPYLNRAFFAEVARTLPEHWLLFVAWRDGERVAASLVALDPARRTAYGRYWGCTTEIPHLHFCACYHEPLDWCIREGWLRFEGGAQGEHKMARGLMPVETHSAHWLRHPEFADAVARHLEREAAGMGAYLDELRERNPFKPS